MALLVMTTALGARQAWAAPVGHAAFARTWERVDGPVAELRATRTWMWGPAATSELLLEPYAEAPGGQRLVQYFDKSRMEITDPGGDPASLWYVTNGLLAKELLTGQLQTGANTFESYAPANINVAGDPDDAYGVTYAVLSDVLGAAPVPAGATLTGELNFKGQVIDNPSLAAYGVTAAEYVPETDHRVASVFWAFMTASGTVSVDGDDAEEQLFPNPFYATGYPLTEAYWTTVRVGGVQRTVLLQCFERRCLTYTPDNPAEWRVEAGNVGQHYVAWRYGQLGQTLVVAPPPPTGDARVTFILADPPAPEGQGEYVEITNFDARALDLTGWTLTDVSGASFTFPPFTLGLDATVTVRNCTGANTPTLLYTGKCGAIWNNGGDTAYLYDAMGTLISTFTY